MIQHPSNEILLDYLHGELSPGDDAAVYAHIEACEPCRLNYESEVAVGEALRAQAAREERELPPAVKAAIWERIRAAKTPAWKRAFGWARPAVAIPAAAVLAAAAYFGTAYIGPHGAPSIDASYYLQDHAAMNSTMPFSDHASASPVDLEAAAAMDAQQAAVQVETASYTADANP